MEISSLGNLPARSRSAASGYRACGLAAAVLACCLALAPPTLATESVPPAVAAPPAQQAAAPVNAPAAAGLVATAPVAPVALAEPAGTSAPRSPAAPTANPAATAAAAEEDPVVCKKITETGTLGRKKKLCMTASEWEQHRKNARGIMRGIDSGAGAQGPVDVPGSSLRD